MENLNGHQRVAYRQNGLIVFIPTSCPESTHELLLRGLAVCLRQNVTSMDKRKDDDDGVVALIELLQSLIPPERWLARS
jgi:hypothetical protein